MGLFSFAMKYCVDVLRLRYEVEVVLYLAMA